MAGSDRRCGRVFAGGGECPAGAAYPQEEKVKQKSNRIKQKRDCPAVSFSFAFYPSLLKNSGRFCAYFFLTNGGAGVLFSVKRK